jgi:hypothetical protein
VPRVQLELVSEGFLATLDEKPRSVAVTRAAGVPGFRAKRQHDAILSRPS